MFQFTVTGSARKTYTLNVGDACSHDSVRAEMAAMYAPQRLRTTLRRNGWTGPITWTTRSGMTVTITKNA
jgi:hypothetical protein